MPLRGSVAKQEMHRVLNARPTLQNQITALRRQVNQQKPETQYYRVSGTHNSTGIGIGQNNHLVTSSLIGSANFRQNVTGDQWANIALNLKFTMAPACQIARVLVYVPKKSGSRFTPASNGTVEHPDPSSFWVVSDTYIRHNDNSTQEPASRRFNLKKLKTIYDSNAVSIERGEIVLTVIYDTAASSGQLYSYGYELVYSNL